MPIPLPTHAVVAAASRAALLGADGVTLLASREAGRVLRGAEAPLLVHAPSCLRRLGVSMPVLDLLELFAFVLPARAAPPTPLGLAGALD
ncbi:MAG: hypothetical protein ACKVQA_10135, partial [Burkholderiales bacterium]